MESKWANMSLGKWGLSGETICWACTGRGECCRGRTGGCECRCMNLYGLHPDAAKSQEAGR